MNAEFYVIKALALAGDVTAAETGPEGVNLGGPHSTQDPWLRPTEARLDDGQTPYTSR